MNKGKCIACRLLSVVLILSVMLYACPGAAEAEVPEAVVLNCEDDAGDYAFFDSDYCYTSGNARYTNMELHPGDNQIKLYRLDYTNPKHKKYIYAERTQTTGDCYFDITLTRSGITRNTGKIYSNILISADIRRTTPGDGAQIFYLTGGAKYGDDSCSAAVAVLDSDGVFTFADGSKYNSDMVNSAWYNYKIALNLAEHTADVYLDGTKIKSQLPLPRGMARLNKVRFSLDEGSVGDFYLDNFRIVGLIEPFVDGVETPTSIFPGETQVREYMADKVGFHAYGQLLCKNNVKTIINPAPIYDKDNEELYVDTATLSRAFDADISVSGSSVTARGKTARLANQPRT
ncbi:MAG: hypothetical protein IJ365_08230, partial [Clostridia bacterium]|nr:hypothetical protein [Clostridia bacterium]